MPEEKWNLKEDPYLSSVRRLEEAKRKPASDSPVARALISTLQLMLEGSPGKAEFTTRSSEEALVGSNPTLEQAETAPRQQEEQVPRRIFPALNLFSPKSQQEASKTSPRTFPVLDLLLRKTKQVSSKKPTTSSEEIYVETEDSYGHRYLRRVAAE